MRVLFVEHAVDFQDVAIAGGSLKLVSGAVEAKDERFLRGEYSMPVVVARRVGRGAVVFFATRARFPWSLLLLFWLVAMRLPGSVDSRL
jgi:hypothetical protein